MKKLTAFLLIINFIQAAIAQQSREKNISVAFMNANTAMPFHKLKGLVTGIVHPGIEIGTGFNWSGKDNHAWFQNFKISYFYHRFVQHAIPINTEFGYRYKVNPHFIAEATLGAGYMHSIPASGVFQFESDGKYSPHKGIGRAQANGTIATSFGYVINPGIKKPIKIFISYQQRLQFPFIKSYVPLLPYNHLLAGVSMRIKN